jgi:polar amino acid transport system substrate-binding protein
MIMHTRIHSLPRPSARLSSALGCLLLAAAALAPAHAAGTLDKIKGSGKLTLGYYSADLRPYAYNDSAGKPAGYAIAVCDKVVDALKHTAGFDKLAVEYVGLGRDEAFGAVDQGKVDLLCGAVPTLERRGLVDFSIPIMLSGTSVAVSGDAPARLVSVLAGRDTTEAPIWRASTDQAPQRAVLAVVGDRATIGDALNHRLKERRIVASVVSAPDPGAGIDMLASGRADAFFEERALLLDAAARRKPGDVVVLDRLFQRNVVALAVRRNDADFRLAVDRALSRFYRTPDLAALYARSFGAPSPSALEFFQAVALPD